MRRHQGFLDQRGVRALTGWKHGVHHETVVRRDRHRLRRNAGRPAGARPYSCGRPGAQCRLRRQARGQVACETGCVASADSGECPTRACNGGGCQAIESEMRARGLDALSSPRGGELSLSSFVGSVREFFLGRTTTGVGTARAPTPRLVGSGQTLQRGATTLLCNTTSRRTSSGESILDHACSTGLRLTEYAGEVCN